MTILCGTDFSDAAAQAVTAAAALARRSHRTLVLVNCLEVPAHEAHDEAERIAERALAAEAQRVRAAGLEIDQRVLTGDPAPALIDLAQRVRATCIVIGPRGEGHTRSKLGRQAEALAARSHVPVLMVRDPAPFVAWAEQEAPLRVLLGADESKTTGAALAFVAALQAAGPCAVSALHLFWPPQEFERFGFGGARSFLVIDPEVREQIESSLVEHWGSLPIEVAPRLGNFADGLVLAAEHKHAQLIVVGTHGRGAMERLREGSVAHGLLQQARTNVVCAPLPADAPAPEVRPLRHVLVATDFSATGNAAIPLAYSSVAPGGTVFIVHVVEPAPTHPLAPSDIFALEQEQTPSAARDSIHERLRALIPPVRGGAPPIHTVAYALASHEPARAIAQAAERVHADVICVGTHGRSGLPQALMGSVAQGVLKHTKRPVLLARLSE